MILCLLAVSAFGQPRNVIISGRVVDEGGKEISNAMVTLYVPPNKGAFELILPGTRSLPDGGFYLDSGRISPSEQISLFIEEPVPEGFWSPFNGPPFGELSRLQIFRGLPITLKPKQTLVNLGEIQPGIRYAKIVIDLTRAWPERDKPTGQEVSSTKLTIRDQLSHVVYDGRIPDAGLDVTTSLLRLALPKGKWSIELSFARESKIVRSPRRTINIRKLSCLNIALTVQRPATSCH